MQEALALALEAYEAGEYPVGAVVVREGKIIGRGRNLVNAELDPTAHAEILAIKQACNELKKVKLGDCILYTTLFPCPICEATIVEVGIENIVYGGETFSWIRDVKFGQARVELKGPIDDRGRVIFQKMLQKRGRTDILDHEAT